MMRKGKPLPAKNRRFLSVMRIGDTVVHRPVISDGNRCALHGYQRAVWEDRWMCWPCHVEMYAVNHHV
jgi:hypothetical protein